MKNVVLCFSLQSWRNRSTTITIHSACLLATNLCGFKAVLFKTFKCGEGKGMWKHVLLCRVWFL